ncbi:Flp pilus assembly protein TadB [Spinactinospora alkalitolerans]|uniref:Flp pilus assembly protein TadB n=1 Tax=Spinactinospora alkalitolerans TaxID=687207 RepID=A0A852U9P7_9ACTN|nr:type II secretion system F family protein [Spinactinospora alkalitolerans]NYE50834.1 Flp pilus assembly protein TadB [Spinactinospora alkalitolerans]
MTPETVAAVIGIGVAGGIGLVIVGCLGQVTAPPRPGEAGDPAGPAPDRRSARPSRITVGALAGVLAGALAWMVTGWPVLLPALPLAVLGLPFLLGGEREARERVDRLAAIEEWVRGLAGRLTAGATLEQALEAGAAGVPAPIRPELQRLAARLRQGQTTPVALRALADELAGFTGDQVVAQLLLAHRRRGPGVAEALGQLAEWVAEEVAALRAVEAERARPRSRVRAVTVVAFGAFAVLAMTGGYMEPYATASGQLVLAVVLCASAGALVWMRRITATPPEPRLFDAPVPQSDATAVLR